jgi:hypothetical protein
LHQRLTPFGCLLGQVRISSSLNFGKIDVKVEGIIIRVRHGDDDVPELLGSNGLPWTISLFPAKVIDPAGT